MKILKTFVAASAILATAPAMSATMINFTNFKATWFDVVGGSDKNLSAAGPSTNASIFWGDPANNDNRQSGYRFETIGSLGLSVDPITQTSAAANIGQFTHYNYPIEAGTGITSAKLKLTTDVTVDGNFFSNVTFIYAFNHTETNNGANPCANGGANNQGVNSNGCADRVAVNYNQFSGAFIINNVEYTLDVQGFLDNNQPVDLFWTKEQATNVADLRGRVVLRSLAGAVPEPATWAMMIGGMTLVGASMRRRSMNVQFG